MSNFQRGITRDRMASYQNERSCINCTYEQECWSGREEIYPPRGFDRRGAWQDRNIISYLKNIYGGICGRINHRDPDVTSGWHSRENIAQTTEKEEPEWEA